MVSHLEHVSGPGSLAPWVCKLVDEFDIEEVTEAVVAADVPSAWPQRTGDAEFAAMLRASALENLRALREFLAGRIAKEDIALRQPPEFGRVQAQLRIPQTALQRSYRVGFLVIWEHWVRHLTDGAQAAGVDPAETLRAVENATRLIFEYQDHALSTVAAAYSQVEEALRSSREHVRHSVIRQLLMDEEAALPARELYLTLAYDLSFLHVAVLITHMLDGQVDSLAAQVRSRCGARSLLYEVRDGETVAWFGRPSSWPESELRKLRSTLADSGASASISETAQGIHGLRETFRQVEQVAAIRRVWGERTAPRVITYQDVRLEALLARDLDAARRFTVEELGELACDKPDAARLRDTLHAWFTLGSHVAAAEALQLHEHTVRNRLRRAEQYLGHPVGERRTEVQVALRLHRILPTGP
jgi:hypothetical protein